MQLKTIKKTIKTKLEEWIETITDLQLKKDLKSNVLVSGGSITSMLLNEQVNDYDVYIKDVNVLIRLCEYYIRHFPNIEILKGWEKSKLLEKFASMPDEEGFANRFHASVSGMKDDQVKLMIKGESGGLRVNENAKEEELARYIPQYFSPNAISLSNKIQIVIRFYGDNEKIHSTFDFMHATNYFTFEEGLVTNIRALESILTKQLMYQGSLYPLTTIVRIKKFLKRGWNINAGEMLKVMFQISELNLKSPDVLEEQLIGVDVAYFDKLIEILRGVDEDKMTSSYLNTIIDRVFNDFEEIEE